MDNRKRVALITGASRGIGRAIAIRLAKAGHKIAINYNSHKNDAIEVLNIIKSSGTEGIIVKADVSKKDEVEFMIKNVEENLGSIEILYNNAGIISDSLFIILLSC